MSRAPAPLRLYGGLSRLLAPVALHRARSRLRAGGIPERRLREREGEATKLRPPGKLIWLHGASVGECLSILPLVETLKDRATILVTSGTATSAQLLARRLPPGALHQFAPIDSGSAVARFLEHWRPDAGALVESEVWPNLIAAADERGIPIALINARMSDRTLAHWARARQTARYVFGRFRFIVAQDQRTRDGIARFIPDTVRLSLGGNMKPASAALPCEPARLREWRSRMGNRPVWMASSTHDGEDTPVLAAHAKLRAARPDALMILAPRHPDRGPAIADLAKQAGFRTARLGADEAIDESTDVLVADTIGDLGLWYRIAPVVFLAGSFGRAGGHNPWEAIQLDAALLHGPNVPNAAQDYAELARAGAARLVVDAETLGDEVLRLLSDSDALSEMQSAARAAARGADDLVARVAADLHALIERSA